MTNLEFIEKEIERYKIIIYGVKTMLKEPHRTEDTITFLKNDLKEYEEKINHLQSIKNELEAWYSVKSGLIYEKENKHRMSEEMRCAYTIYLTDNEMERIQKNLRIKDESR